MDRVIQMILNRLLGQLVNRGIKAGLNHVSGKPATSADMTPEDRKTEQVARKAGQRARQAANMAKRLMR
jgi:hypothetical protein